MKKIFVDEKLMHMIFRKEDIKKGRIDVAPEEQFIQVSALSLEKGKKFRPHKHIWKKPNFLQHIAQESWCVIEGKVLGYFYDTEGNLLETHELNQGDISLTFEGGHTYEILEDCLVYEYKTGPYEGQERDKVFLENVI